MLKFDGRPGPANAGHGRGRDADESLTAMLASAGRRATSPSSAVPWIS
jgi:hypothetical protein